MTLNSPTRTLDTKWLLGIGLPVILLGAVWFFFMIRDGELATSFERHHHRHDEGFLEKDMEALNQASLAVEAELRDRPEDPVLLGKRAHLLLEKNPAEAVSAYRDLLKKGGSDPYIKLHLAEALTLTGRYQEAMVYGAELLARERTLEVLELIARIHYEKGQYQKALEYAEEILERRPSHETARLLRDYSRQGLELMGR